MAVSKKAYWYYLFSGWIIYAIFYFYVNSVGYIDSLQNASINCLLTIIAGVAISAAYRYIAIEFGWLELPLKWLVLKVVLAVVVMASVMTVVNLLIENFTFPQFTQDITGILLVRYFGSWLEVIFIYTFIYHLFVYYERSVIAEKAKVSAELDTLRLQINPHFYFNTLNNLYGLALEKSSRTAEAILKLANIMEYVIYDCRSNTVPLNKEVNFIESYIQLERLRYEEDINITFLNEIKSNDLLIAPMLLIPFVENSFKHSNEKMNAGFWIFIKTYLVNNHLFFIVKNSSKFQQKVGGIGLENIQRRLNFLYPGKYQLEIGNKEEEFEVTLSIEL